MWKRLNSNQMCEKCSYKEVFLIEKFYCIYIYIYIYIFMCIFYYKYIFLIKINIICIFPKFPGNFLKNLNKIYTYIILYKNI